MKAVSRRITIGQHKSAVWLLIDVVNPVKDSAICQMAVLLLFGRRLLVE